jgi:hypothetical protein
MIEFNILSTCRIIAKISSGLFAGNSLYVSLVEHPARMECSTNVAITVFKSSFKRVAKLQAVLAVSGFLSSTGVYLLEHDSRWLASGLLLLSVFPYTFLVMWPTNKLLLDEKIDKDSDKTKYLLQKWGRMHMFRTVISSVTMLLVNIF